MAQPRLDLGNVGLVGKRIGRGRRSQRMHAETVHLSIDAGFKAIMAHDVAIDRRRIECPIEALRRSVVLDRTEEGTADIGGMPGKRQVFLNEPLSRAVLGAKTCAIIKSASAPSMRAQRSNFRDLAVVALASAAIEALCFWGLYAWIQWNFLGRHPVAALEEWSMMTALVVHLPPMWVLSTLFHGGGVARWPVLFFMGYSEWFFAIAAILWARRTLRDSLHLLSPLLSLRRT